MKVPTLLTLLILFTSCQSMSIWMRTTWLSEIPEKQWRSWFELVRWGKSQGPASDYYLQDLGIQQTATGGWPPKNANNPGIFYSHELQLMSEYFDLFDRVWVGTLLLPDVDFNNQTWRTEYARYQVQVGQQFIKELSHRLPKDRMGWYITQETCLDEITSPDDISGFAAFLNTCSKALKSVQDVPILWSPSLCNRFEKMNVTLVQQSLEKLFCQLDYPIEIHFQDACGQTSTFEFPFHYNYTNAHTCQADGAPFYQLLSKVSQKCPHGLSKVKVNAELFVEKLHNGKRSEGNGAYILSADPASIGDRLSCYSQLSVPVGVCWALPHWYDVFSYANHTMDFQCSEPYSEECKHPY